MDFMKTIKTAIIVLASTLGAIGVYLIGKIIYLYMYGSVVFVVKNQSNVSVDPAVSTEISNNVTSDLALFGKLDTAIVTALSLVGFAIILTLFAPFIKEAWEKGKKGKGGSGSVMG